MERKTRYENVDRFSILTAFLIITREEKLNNKAKMAL